VEVSTVDALLIQHTGSNAAALGLKYYGGKAAMQNSTYWCEPAQWRTAWSRRVPRADRAVRARAARRVLTKAGLDSGKVLEAISADRNLHPLVERAIASGPLLVTLRCGVRLSSSCTTVASCSDDGGEEMSQCRGWNHRQASVRRMYVQGDADDHDGLCNSCAPAKLRHERDGMRNDQLPKAKGIRQVDALGYGYAGRRKA